VQVSGWKEVSKAQLVAQYHQIQSLNLMLQSKIGTNGGGNTSCGLFTLCVQMSTQEAETSPQAAGLTMRACGHVLAI
jgi:hypothetical protein